jgi:hypothetical protein
MKKIYLIYIIFLVPLILISCNKSKIEKRNTQLPLISAKEALQLDDEKLLDEIEYRIFNYFWNEIYPETGIAYDHTQNKIGKVAATGFELVAVCIGIERNWVSYEDGYKRCLLILNTFWDDPEDPDDIYVEGEYGLYWHFIDGRTGKKAPIDCVAMCDSADFIAGVLIAGEYFKGTEIEELSKKIYDNIQWNKFAVTKEGKAGLLSFGWVPPQTSETYYDIDGLLPFNMGFLSDNSLLIYAMALGSNTHPITEDTWQAYMKTYSKGMYAGYECHMTGALFNREVPYSFIDPRRKKDANIDYYLDTINAILADMTFNQKENEYPSWAWGLSDCFGKESYSHAAPPGYIANDGTIATNAFVCSLPFLPQASIAAIRKSIAYYGDKYFGRYGLPSSYNLKTDFISPFYVGIETGPMMCMIENYRSQMVWDLFMQTDVMNNFFKRGKFSGVIDDFELPPEAPAYALWDASKAEIKIVSSSPQNGKKCLSVNSGETQIQLSAQLSENDLLRYNYNKYISLWSRDMRIDSVSIKTGGLFYKKLKQTGSLPSGQWCHYYFKLPENLTNKQLKSILLKCTITGLNPAIDNITSESKAIIQAPASVEFISAYEGQIGKSISLNWRKTDAEDIKEYIIYISKSPLSTTEDYKKAERIIVTASDNDSEIINKTILRNNDDLYYFNVQARDKWGHLSSPSNCLSSRSNPLEYEPVLYDFKTPQFSQWRAINPCWKFEVVNIKDEQSNDTKALKIHFIKTDNAWDYIEVAIDAQKLSIHRYITLKVKGKVKILAKLFIDDNNQQDIEIAENKDDGWNILTFDTQKAHQLKNNLDEVEKILLFIEPGTANTEGEIYIDELSLTY